MHDRAKAFAAMDCFRTILRSDETPTEIVKYLDIMVTEVEELTLDENVWTMIQALVEETDMRVKLICGREATLQLEESLKLREKLLYSLQHINKWTQDQLDKGRRMDLIDIQERLKSREAFRERMANLGW